jgi:type I restriction-modification system DNA methylase subunit
MPLFQESIVKKYLSTIDEELIEKAFNEFKRVYSADKIKNIKIAKEEQYQEGFIKDIFGQVLGYSVFPEQPFNIQTEKKNQSDSKKADGAIFKEDNVVGVIELKDNKTKNLDAVKDQAFGYKNNHKDCSYIISSNFHKLRFYIDDATEYEEFDLYNLDKEAFKRFYLYLRKEGLLDKNIPKLLRQETKFHEEEISKKLYRDYSQFKKRFYENALKHNPQHDKVVLLKKSQKFLDRILFLLFAEDKGLVGTNSIVKIVEKWANADDDNYRPLYELINIYFGHLYKGYVYQRTGEIIPEFGGELFAPDDVLDGLTIEDLILKNDLLILSKYDFNTDVDVNILGHIFEHSLNEVEDVEAELRREVVQKNKSKRKKDGVFYTPKYITKYIIENTVGKLCIEKKVELKLDEDYSIFEYKRADGKLNEKGKDLFERLNHYKSWLLTLKVCDPACGSGAFLNQALSFFIEEHKFVDDLIAELTNTPLRLFDTDLQILENNIFGVDINEESIEIAKLSLWLRTAKPGRKLTNLSNNIKCGNSLIDNSEIAGEKAFNWKNEFHSVFEKGGFDVVVGNPPYVFARENFSQSEKDYYVQNYKSAKYQINTYLLFIEKTIDIINDSRNFGLIIPNSWLMVYSGETLRRYLLENCSLNKIVNLEGYSFESANVETVILLANKSKAIKKSNFEILLNNGKEFYLSHVKNQEEFLHNEGCEFKVFLDATGDELTKKILENSSTLSDIVEIKAGLQAYEKGKGDPIQNEEDVINRPYDYNYKFDENTFKYLDGKDVNRYLISWSGLYLRYGKHLAAPRTWDLFGGKKIIVREITGKYPNCIISTYSDEIYLYNRSNIAIIEKAESVVSLKYIVALLNSKLLSYYFLKNTAKSVRKIFPKIILNDLRKFPVKVIDHKSQEPFIFLAEKILDLNQRLLDISRKFITYLNSNINLQKPNSKLEKWYEITFSEFIIELNKNLLQNNKTPLSKKDEFEWMELFEENKKILADLKLQIDQIDKEIDGKVYQLYGLTEEEIKIVEDS